MEYVVGLWLYDSSGLTELFSNPASAHQPEKEKHNRLASLSTPSLNPFFAGLSYKKLAVSFALTKRMKDEKENFSSILFPTFINYV